MKTLKHILSLALLIGSFAACNDGPELDKAKLGDYGSTLLMWQNGDCFELDWSDSRLYTTDGYHVVTIDNKLSFDVGVSIFDGSTPLGSHFYVVKKVDGTQTKATINISEIVAVLGQKVFTEQVEFGLFLVDENDKVVSTIFSASDWIDTDKINEIRHEYEKDNSWFFCGTAAEGEVQSDMPKIEVGACAESFEAQLCNIFHGLDNQRAGESFELTFDVMWVGADNRDSKSISIWTGKNPDYDFLHYNYRWTDENTELLNPDGSCIQSVEDIRLPNRQFTTVALRGTIGKAGADYIGIQINLGENNEMEESVGTFYFKNMRVRMGGKIVSESYMERTQGDYLISVEPSDGGQVLGAGYYNSGESVELTAIPDRNKFFNGWSDGQIDNPRTVWVTGNTQVKAIFWDYDIDHLFQLSITASGGGYVFGATIYRSGEEAELTAVAEDGYRFAGWSDGSTENPRKFFVTEEVDLVAYFIKKISVGYNYYNEWYIELKDEWRNAAIGDVSDDGISRIHLKKESSVLGVQYCVAFSELEGQMESLGKPFKLSFEVKWESDDSDEASFSIYTGKWKWSDYYEYSDYEYQWEINSEIIFVNGLRNQFETEYTANNEWKRYEIEGTIGKDGLRTISVQMNLSGYEKGDVKKINSQGTFSFKNITVEIDGESVWTSESD